MRLHSSGGARIRAITEVYSHQSYKKTQNIIFIFVYFRGFRGQQYPINYRIVYDPNPNWINRKKIITKVRKDENFSCLPNIMGFCKLPPWLRSPGESRPAAIQVPAPWLLRPTSIPRIQSPSCRPLPLQK